MKNIWLFLVLFGSVSAQAQLRCVNLPGLMDIYVSNHYSMNSMNSELKRRTADKFIKDLDQTRMNFLADEATKYQNEIVKMFDTMKDGKCDALVNIQKFLEKKAEMNLTVVNETVTDKFTPNPDAKTQTDPQKRAYAKNEDERKELIKNSLNVQLAYLMAADTSIEKARKQLKKRYELGLKRVKELNQEKLIGSFASSFARSLDPHSEYLSADVLEDFKINMNLSLEGIGVSLTSEDGFTIVQEIIAGGSADRAHALQPKDKIIAVAQDKGEATSIIDMDLTDVVKLIRGKKGTKVKLTLVRQSGAKSETKEVVLIRDKVDMKDQAAKMSMVEKEVNGKKLKIAVIDLPQFYGGNDRGGRSGYQDMVQLVKEANDKKADAMVLDLSSNGGGLLQDAVRISGLFIRQGGIVATQDGKQNREVLQDEDPKVQFKGPLVVLTSRQTASASEILSGALKDYKRAVIVGSDHTYGKGSVQVLQPIMMNMGAMKLTTQMFFLPGGASTQHQGVAGDILLPYALDAEDYGEKYQDYALPPSRTATFTNAKSANSEETSSHWNPISDGLVKKLAENSKKRVEKDKELQEIVKEVGDAKREGGWIKVSEILEKSKEDEGKRKERKALATTAKGRQSLWLKIPQLQEAIAIAADWAASDKGTLSSK